MRIFYSDPNLIKIYKLQTMSWMKLRQSNVQHHEKFSEGPSQLSSKNITVAY